LQSCSSYVHVCLTLYMIVCIHGSLLYAFERNSSMNKYDTWCYAYIYGYAYIKITWYVGYLEKTCILII